MRFVSRFTLPSDHVQEAGDERDGEEVLQADGADVRRRARRVEGVRPRRPRRHLQDRLRVGVHHEIHVGH